MTKEGLRNWQVYSAIGMLVFGCILTAIAFFMGGGKIDNSVLWVFAQCLIYAGSALGIAAYVKKEVAEQVKKQQ